ncbi:MAG: hypothetical protein HC869_18305 [Rhodospirillales bacterium]|nr:hypothetical protein [Rhodospirillales bacterium]
MDGLLDKHVAAQRPLASATVVGALLGILLLCAAAPTVRANDNEVKLGILYRLVQGI